MFLYKSIKRESRMKGNVFAIKKYQVVYLQPILQAFNIGKLDCNLMFKLKFEIVFCYNHLILQLKPITKVRLHQLHCIIMRS